MFFEHSIIHVANLFKGGIIKAIGKLLDEVIAIIMHGKPVYVSPFFSHKEPIKCDAWTDTSHSSKGHIDLYCNFQTLFIFIKNVFTF